MNTSVDEKYEHNSHYCPEANPERDTHPWRLIISHKRKINYRKTCKIDLDINSRHLKYRYFFESDICSLYIYSKKKS